MTCLKLVTQTPTGEHYEVSGKWAEGQVNQSYFPLFFMVVWGGGGVLVGWFRLPVQERHALTFFYTILREK